MEPILKRKSKNKKSKLLVFAFLGIIFIGVSYAFYYNEFVFPNEFKTMTYNVKLEEEFENKFGVKKVKIVNRETTNTPVVLRLNFNETWKKRINDEDVILNNLSNNYNCVYKEWTNDFLNDFILGNDGWYYYKKTLNANSEVQILQSIADNNVCNYENATYELDFNYEAIQASTNAVSDIWNYNISINNNNVTWPFTGNNPNVNQLRGV